MNFGEATKSAFENYATFRGRALRSEFWYFVLFYFLLNIIALIIDFTIINQDGLGFDTAGAIVGVALFLPYLSVSVRRLHDIDKSGWFLFLIIIPIVGAILFIVWACSKGTEGENRFGPSYFGNIENQKNS